VTLEAIFFVDRTSGAIGVASSADLAVDPACESLRLRSPAALLALARILGPNAQPAVEPLRDATCQSFPVWIFAREARDALVNASDETLERIGDQWWDAITADEVDAESYELAERLQQLQAELCSAEPDAQLLVLLEQKAL
jgi:hypothetical protein